jgi:hypothetical protein
MPRETADGSGTKATKPTKITKCLVVFVIFVSFVPLPWAVSGRLGCCDLDSPFT